MIWRTRVTAGISQLAQAGLGLCAGVSRREISLLSKFQLSITQLIEAGVLGPFQSKGKVLRSEASIRMVIFYTLQQDRICKLQTLGNGVRVHAF
jgi:hypothetical protein